MRKFVRWVGRLLATLAVAAAVLLGLVYWRSGALLSQRIALNEAALAIPADADAVARGEHLAVTRGCTDCHEHDLGGKVLVDAAPIGRIAAPNLTRGRGGIGARLDAVALERAVRHGVDASGRPLLYMPSVDFAGLADSDTADLIAYVRALPPVDRDIPAATAGPLMRTLFVLGKAPLVDALRIDHAAAHPTSMAADASSAYGGYLAHACSGCHGEHFSGGPVPGAPPGFPSAANITPDPSSGIGNWSKVDFYTAMRTGKRPDGRTLDTFMPWRAFATMTDTELDALWSFLHAQPARAAGGH
ncbi:MAG TPA: c-type cytochrome [Rudaea sp.]|nr:c-type cytochrome [Rudaea sp.]